MQPMDTLHPPVGAGMGTGTAHPSREAAPGSLCVGSWVQLRSKQSCPVWGGGAPPVEVGVGGTIPTGGGSCPIPVQVPPPLS